MKTGIAIFTAIYLALGAPSSARAEPTAELEQNASAHFEKGLELYREGSLDAALVEFERAYALIPNYRLLYNLAQIQAERHEYVAAVGLFEKYLATGGTEIDEARRAEAQQEIDKLRTRISYLMVDSNVAGARLFVNDVQVGTLPLNEAVPINSGVSNIRLESAGYAPASTQLKVAGGERPRLNLPLITSERARANDRASPSAREANYQPFWISAGATLALGGATLGLGLTARAADQDLDAALQQVPLDQAEVDDARAQLKLCAALTDAFAVASVAGLGVALYFLFAPPRAKGAGKETARAVHLSPSTRGLGLRATF
jgi:tetratricopeptide (TPR) repeat protein